MELLDVVPRFAGVGILLLACALLLGEARASWAARFVAAFALTSAGYLFCSYAPVRAATGPWLPGLTMVCLAGPAFLWLSALAIFVDDFTPRWRHWAALAALEVVGLATLWSSTLQDVYGFLHAALVVGMFTHAVVVAWRGLDADLIESRREFRLVFIGAVSVFGLTVTAVEVAYIGRTAPAYLETMAAWTVFIIAFGLLFLALRIDPQRLFLPASRPAPTSEPRAARESLADSTPTDRALLGRVIAAMEDERLYRHSGLTISALAETLNVPEHHVRRTINQGLGYRNFSTFLNHYRLDEVKQGLTDPTRVRTPILTLALDAGYGSLAPFNRAFKASFGITPSTFRRLNLSEAYLAEDNNADRMPKTLIDSQKP